MKAKIQMNQKGIASFDAVLTATEYGEAISDLASSNHNITLFAGGDDYCLTRTKPGLGFGKKTTIHVGNTLFASPKATTVCGGGFSVTRGRRRD